MNRFKIKEDRDAEVALYFSTKQNAYYGMMCACVLPAKLGVITFYRAELIHLGGSGLKSQANFETYLEAKDWTESTLERNIT